MDCKTSFGGRNVLCCCRSSSRLVIVVDEPKSSSLRSVKNVDDFDDEFCNATRLLRLPPLFAKCTPLLDDEIEIEIEIVAGREFKIGEAIARARVYRELTRKDEMRPLEEKRKLSHLKFEFSQ